MSHPSTESLQASDQPVNNKANNKPLRRWMLVINNPSFKESEQIYALKDDPHVAGLIWSAEHAHDTKDNENANLTEHYHIYISFNNPIRQTWIKAKFPRAHIEPAHKPALACCRYVAKEGFFMAFGNVPDINQESRTAKKKAEDLAREEVVKKIRNGEMRVQDLSDAQLLDTKLVRAAKEAASMTQGPMRHGVKVCVFVSPSGWGKSYNVWETFQRVAGVEFSNNQQWFLDAEQEVMLFDEFAGLQTQCRAQRMLKYLDENPISLPVKGGHRPCYWKLVFILSNTPPNEWYMVQDKVTGALQSSIPEHTRDALYRRIGYGKWEGVDPNRQTHVYMEPFSDLNTARAEIKRICVQLHSELYPEKVPSPICHDDPDQVQKDQEDERQAIRNLAEIHGINIDEEEARWDRAREIQREREEHELDDMPELEPDDPQSEQDPEATVPTLSQNRNEEISDDDTCPDPPSDHSDIEDITDDSDFEH